LVIQQVSANRQKQDFNERLITTEIEKTNAIKELVEAQQRRTGLLSIVQRNKPLIF
jgi:hypothetical protein